MANQALTMDSEVLIASVNRIATLVDEIKVETQSYLNFMEGCTEKVQNGDKSFNVIVNVINTQKTNIQNLIAAQDEVRDALNRYIEGRDKAEAENEALERALAD